MKSYSERLQELAVNLIKIEAFKFGNFKIKSGIESPVYFDLRVIVSHPTILEEVSNLLLELISETKYEHLCGVPYTALPIATVLSIKSKLPMLIRRKEAKSYGTKKLIEGQFKTNDRCIIIEDVITSGSSVLETAKDLWAEGLIVTDAFVILDRQQGGLNNLNRNQINVKSLFTMMDLMKMLLKMETINQAYYDSIEEYLKKSQSKPIDIRSSALKNTTDRIKMTYEERLMLAQNPVAKKLFKIMIEKKTNLCLAADVTNCADIIKMLDTLGPHICVFKTHVDIVEEFSLKFIEDLAALAKKHNVILMEDRKFGDIGNTVSLQCSNGVYNVSDWADLVTVVPLSGPGVIKGIKQAMGDRPRGIFLVVEMSSEGNLITDHYKDGAFKMAEEESGIVAGVVCQTKGLLQSPGLLQLTPGVQISGKSDGLGQQYCSPEDVMILKGADIAVVGRGIIKAEDPIKAAISYKEKLWQSYEKRLE